MGAQGQGVGDGHSPGHQPLHRSSDPAGGNPHHTRGESEDGQKVINAHHDEKISSTLILKKTVSSEILELN